MMAAELLEIEIHADGGGAGARQLIVVVQGVEMIVAVGEVEEAEADFGAAAEEAPAGVGVELPEVIARLGGCVAAVVLAVPFAVETGEEAGGMDEQDVETGLLESGRGMRGGGETDACGNLRKAAGQFRVS